MSEKQAVLPELEIRWSSYIDAIIASYPENPTAIAIAKEVHELTLQCIQPLLQSLADAGIEVEDGKVFRPQRDNDFLHAAEYAGVPFDRAAAVAVALTHRGWRTPLAPPTDSTKKVTNES